MAVMDELKKVQDGYVAARRLVDNVEAVKNGNPGLSWDSVKRNHSIIKCGEVALDGLIEYFGVAKENGK